jgi:anti-anti-sigma factor
MMACPSDSQNPLMNHGMLIDIEPHGSIYILHCRGRFASGAQIEYMQSKLNEVRRLQCTHVLADFHGVTAIGSMGIGFLVGVYTSIVSKAGGRFVLVGANPLVRTVLDLTCLDTVIPLAPDFSSGLQFLVEAFSNPRISLKS